MAIRFGVMSDTHGNLAFGSKAADAMIEAGVAHIYHLGDDYEDAEALRFSGLDVRAVPGLWCPEYRNGSVSKIITDEIEGVRLACAHTVEELRGAGTGAGLYFFGHTHHAVAEWRDGVIHVNPGHLKRKVDRDDTASYALVDVDAGRVTITVMELEGGQRFRCEFNPGAQEC